MEKFRAVLQLGGKTATGIQVPPEVVAALGSSKRLPVRVTIHGYTYRTTVAPYQGVYMLPVSAEHREGAGIAAGDEVEIGLELDNEPREVRVPPDFAAALERDPEARRFFNSLSYSSKLRFVLPVEEAKTPETRQRRIQKTIEKLREGRI
jgi:hypothetical protein